MAVKGILLPTLNMVLKTPYPLLVEQQPPISPPSDISPSPSSLSSAGPESLEDDQIESEENYIKVRANNDKAEKHGQMKPGRKDQDKQGEISLDVREEEKIEGKMEPEGRTLESSRADTGVEAPG